MASGMSRRGLLGAILGAVAGRLFGGAAAPAAPAGPSAPEIPRCGIPRAAGSVVPVTTYTYDAGRAWTTIPGSVTTYTCAGERILPSAYDYGLAGRDRTAELAGDPAVSPRKRTRLPGPVGA